MIFGVPIYSIITFFGLRIFKISYWRSIRIPILSPNILESIVLLQQFYVQINNIKLEFNINKNIFVDVQYHQ